MGGLDAWSSIAGCYLYLIRSRGASRGVLAMFGVAMCVSILCAVEYQRGYTLVDDAGTRLTVAVLVVVLHIAFLTLALRWWSLPSLRIWFWLGAVTYPLYLLHARAGKAIWKQLPGDEWLRLCAVLVLILLISAAFALTIERRACRTMGHALEATSARVSGWL